MIDDTHSLLDPKHIRIFVAVAESGTMSQVGKQFNISQSGISQTISNLEEQLQVELFSRERRPLVLTRMGEILYTHALKILACHNEAFRAMTAPSSKHLPKLHIAMANSCAEVLAPKLINEHDFVNCWQISSGITPDHIDLFIERRVDMVVAIDEMLEGLEPYECFELLSEPYVLAIPSNYKGDIDIDSLASTLTFIRYGLNSSTGNRIEQQLARMHATLPHTIEIESVVAQMELIQAGKGFGLTTPLCFVNHAKNFTGVRLEPLIKGKFTRRINLIARKEEDHAIAVEISRKCREILKYKCFRALTEQYGWLQESFKFF